MCAHHRPAPPDSRPDVMTTMSSLPPTTTLVTNHTVTQDNGSALSVPPHCVAVKLDERGFLPWDNPGNIVSAQVEEVSRRVKDAYLLPGLFLVGGPANVINLLVFYKQGLRDRIKKKNCDKKQTNG